uniref:C2H2-type domain-containing protein n=1 Tax=Amphilophus citrinellus TaxID=61819 RepID=A0A3Q0RI06_AMPCI
AADPGVSAVESATTEEVITEEAGAKVSEPETGASQEQTQAESLYSLRIHMLNHTGVRPHSCKVCGKTFAHKHSLKMHRALHDVTKQFQCHCDKRFYEAKDLQQHMNKHMGLKPFQCQVCGKCYSWKKDWYSHVKSHSVAEPFK